MCACYFECYYEPAITNVRRFKPLLIYILSKIVVFWFFNPVLNICTPEISPEEVTRLLEFYDGQFRSFRESVAEE